MANLKDDYGWMDMLPNGEIEGASEEFAEGYRMAVALMEEAIPPEVLAKYLEDASDECIEIQTLH